MRYKLLGRSGLRVAELSLGALTFGEGWGNGAPKPEARRIFDAYVERGGNFIDTANKYIDGTSEAFVGEFMQGRRDRLVLATKYSLTMDPDDPNGGGNHRKSLKRAVEGSLERLRTDYIDLYWVHNWDYMTPVEEVMRALDDLVREGKVLYIGISNTPAWIVSHANTLAEMRGWTRFVALQIEYSLLERTPEREYLPMSRAMDQAFVAWAPLAGGMLTGKYTGDEAHDRQVTRCHFMNQQRYHERNLAVAREVDRIAREIGRPSSQVAINWVRQRPGVVIPIVGARTHAQIEDNLAALEWTLDEQHLRQLDEISAIPMGYPYDFVDLERIQRQIHGNTRPRIDNHHWWS